MRPDCWRHGLDRTRSPKEIRCSSLNGRYLMALRELLVHVDDSTAAVTRMRLAADLAQRHGARLSALYVNAISDHELRLLRGAELGLLPARKLEELQNRMADLSREVAARLRTTLAHLGDHYGHRQYARSG